MRAKTPTLWAGGPLEELGQIIDRVEAGARDGSIRGLVIISGKEKGFIVGADIREFADFTTEEQVIGALKPVNEMLDRIENLSVPVAAANSRGVRRRRPGAGPGVSLPYRHARRCYARRVPGGEAWNFPRALTVRPRSIRQAGPLAAMQAMLKGVDDTSDRSACARLHRSTRRQ